MLDVCLLGTAGMMPLPNRWLTALSLKYNGSNILIDCGEGTQIAMKEAGIFDGDLCLVDKAEEMEHGNIVAAYVNGGFTVKYLDTSTKDQGFIRLVPANKDFKPFIIDSSDEFTVWGKVIFTIRDWRNSYCLPL